MQRVRELHPVSCKDSAAYPARSLERRKLWLLDCPLGSSNFIHIKKSIDVLVKLMDLQPTMIVHS